MRTNDLLLDAFGRVRERVHSVLEGLSADQLSERVHGEANSIGWLVWHLTRVQDSHLAEVVDTQQVWTANGWVGRFQLPLDESDTGYGHSSEQVAQVRIASTDLLTGYLDDVHARTVELVTGLTDEDLDRVVDEGWDPPVTLGVRLISVIDDDLEHLGQAAFARGLLAPDH